MSPNSDPRNSSDETKAGLAVIQNPSTASFDKDIPGRIAVHCLAGLGR